MPTHEPDPQVRTGTVYGAGGAPLTPASAPLHRWLLPAAVAVGASGVLVGLVLALGLTPFGPDGAAAPAPPPAAQSTTAPPAGGAAGATTPPPTPTPTPSPTPSPTPDPTRQEGALRSAATAMCLQGEADEEPEGARVQQVPCSGASAQRWRTAPADNGAVTIVNVDTDTCLDVKGRSRDDGAAVQQFRCHGNENQQWRIVPVAAAFALVSVNSGKCLDVPGARAEPELEIEQHACNGTPAQLWTWVG